jgi:predicted transcriptional regulator
MIDRLENQLLKEERDLRVLRSVLRDHPIGIVSIAQQTDIPQHKVRYSLRMLENDELIEATPQGAIPADGIEDHLADLNEGLDELIGRLRSLDRP